ncbi:uncharacterized protein VTP21DRAFT_2666 [Calcarisporiella thermophila]|uniref:uncharacterized protein n=1 Tax=Calcarisporiella thermophila TaxID=911321 RepID=UPI0037448BC5
MLFQEQIEGRFVNVASASGQTYGSLLQTLIPDLDRELFGPNAGIASPSITRPVWNRKWAQLIHFNRFPGCNFVTNDMFSLLIEKMSSLSMDECVAKTFPRYNVKNLEIEKASRLFCHRDPLKSITLPQGIMLINGWFFKHINPHPLILNRSIMIKNFCEQQIDPFLYATLFGKVMVMCNDETARFNGEMLIDYALTLLENEPYNATLPRMQGLYIMAGHMNYLGDSKKCSALYRLALRIGKELRIPEQDMEHFDMQLDPVERELRNNVWWGLRIALTWEAFHLGNRLEPDVAAAPIKLPVKDEHESALFALDEQNGFSIHHKEHIHLIRSFYNCACLSVFLTEIWQRVIAPPESSPSTEFRDASSAVSSMERLLLDFTNNLDPVYAAEQLLYLKILRIHSHFSKARIPLPLSLRIGVIMECVTSANMIVQLAETVLKDVDSLPMHPVVVFGLNTSAFVYSLLLALGTPQQREEALRRMRRVLQLVKTKGLACCDVELIHTIEGLLANTEKHQTSSVATDPSQSLIPVEAPLVSLRSLSNTDRINGETSSHRTLSMLLMPNPNKSTSALTLPFTPTATTPNATSAPPPTIDPSLSSPSPLASLPSLPTQFQCTSNEMQTSVAPLLCPSSQWLSPSCSSFSAGLPAASLGQLAGLSNIETSSLPTLSVSVRPSGLSTAQHPPIVENVSCDQGDPVVTDFSSALEIDSARYYASLNLPSALPTYIDFSNAPSVMDESHQVTNPVQASSRGGTTMDIKNSGTLQGERSDNRGIDWPSVHQIHGSTTANKLGGRVATNALEKCESRVKLSLSNGQPQREWRTCRYHPIHRPSVRLATAIFPGLFTIRTSLVNVGQLWQPVGI